MGYGFESVQFSSAVEYRLDKTQQPDQTTSERTTWLYRNSFKYQLTPDWRLIGKFNHAESKSSLGTVLRRRIYRSRARLWFSPGRSRSAERVGEVHVLLQRADDRAGDAAATLAQFIQKSHIAALDVTYDITDRGRSAASTPIVSAR